MLSTILNILKTLFSFLSFLYLSLGLSHLGLTAIKFFLFLSYIKLFSVYNSRKWKRDAETLCGRQSDWSCLHCSHIFYLVHDVHERLHAGLEIAEAWNTRLDEDGGNRRHRWTRKREKISQVNLSNFVGKNDVFRSQTVTTGRSTETRSKWVSRAAQVSWSRRLSCRHMKVASRSQKKSSHAHPEASCGEQEHTKSNKSEQPNVIWCCPQCIKANSQGIIDPAVDNT